ncbi:MAG TPA: hypothetical protein VJJ23_05235 [Candidatus Nanoarchaeia archaeon]|nr:hypothetical protein [Candidatus Nanoarchaeia archaeon]
MADITIVNKKTVKRRLRQLGITSLLLFSLYPINLANKNINNYFANRKVEHAIKENHYNKANENLIEIRYRLDETQIESLVAQITHIHPDSLYKKASAIENDDKKLESLREINDEYTQINKQNQELKETYLRTYILSITEKLKKNENARFVDSDLANLLGDEIVFTKGVVKTVDVPESFIDQLVSQEAAFIAKYNCEESSYLDSIVSRSIALIKKLSPENNQEKIGIILESYAQYAKIIIPKACETSNTYKLNILKSLKNSETENNYKLLGFDVDQAILDLVQNNNL